MLVVLQLWVDLLSVSFLDDISIFGIDAVCKLTFHYVIYGFTAVGRYSRWRCVIVPLWRYLKSTMGNITLIQTVRKDDQVPETRDRKAGTLLCILSLFYLPHFLSRWRLLPSVFTYALLRLFGTHYRKLSLMVTATVFKPSLKTFLFSRAFSLSSSQ